MPVSRVLFAVVVLVGVMSPLSACTSSPAPDAAKPAEAVPGPSPQPYGTLAEVMRSIPFPNSNIIFDTQTADPGAPKTEKKSGTETSSATAAFAGVYTGWPLVESAAVALAEMSNLIMIPGRLCSNGRPVPLDREDFRKAAQGLADAGKAALKAAQSKNQDAMIEVSGTVADACSACHEVYRDKPDLKDRCVP